MAEWTVVIPVKGTASAKSRLGATPALALAIALDTVAAVLACRFPASSVRRAVPSHESVPAPGPVGAPTVVVVTSPSIGHEFEALGARVVVDDGVGLDQAIRQGITAATGPVAVLLGDLPALLPGELTTALELAAHHPLAFVADADNEGTVLITALNAASHRPAFGAESRAAHLAAGYVELAMPTDSGLRRDVDTPAQLAALASRTGPRTRALL